MLTSRAPLGLRPTDGWLLGALTGLGYLIELCPGIYWRDAGELGSAAFSLGVAHPTGFPTWLLLAKLAALLPFGQVAFRINLLCAVAAAAAVGLAYRVGLGLVHDRSLPTRAAMGAACLVLGLGQTLWLHATTTEVYAPNLLAVVWLVHLHLQAVEGRSIRALRAKAVLTGIGAGLHAVFVLVAAGSWALLLIRSAARRRLRADLVWTVVLGAAGALVILYLPIRALQDPWRNWGDPSSASRLLAHLTGASIRDAFSGEMASGGRWMVNLTTAVEQLIEQVGLAGLLAAPGLAWMALYRPYAALVVGVVLVTDLLFTSVLNPMGMEDRQTGLCATLATSWAIGAGGAFVGMTLTRHFRPRGAAVLLFLGVAGLGTPAMLAGGTDRANRYLLHPTDLADQPFDHADPGALFLVSGDDLASATTYLQGVENRRPDVAVIVKQQIADPIATARVATIYGESTLPPDLMPAIERGERPPQLLQRLLDHSEGQRPVYWELGDGVVDPLVDARLRPDLPMGRLFGRKADAQGLLFARRRRWRRLTGRILLPTVNCTLAHQISLIAGQMVRANPAEGWPTASYAKNLAALAFAMCRDDARVTNRYAMLLQAAGPVADEACRRERPNLARRVAECGLTGRGCLLLHRDLRHHAEACELAATADAKAEARFLEVVAARPDYAMGWYNLGTARVNRQDLGGAAEAFEEAAQLGAGASRAARMAYWMGLLHAQKGEYATAHAMIRLAAPGLPAAMRSEAEARLRVLDRELLFGAE